MKHVIKKLTYHLTDLRQAKKLAQAVCKNKKASFDERFLAYEQMTEITENISQTEIALILLKNK